uniref:Lipocalin n=1 Tax=Rhipicephalus appendiculatus TaxID=34631 RepID=A0A131YFE8_RHIAP
MMGCNVSPLLALICWLHSGYITVHGKTTDPKISDTRQFLGQTGDIYLVGLTGVLHQGSSNPPKMCLRARYDHTLDSQVRRRFKFIEDEQDENQDIAQSGESEQPTGPTKRRELTIGLSVFEPTKQLHAVDVDSLLAGGYENTPPQDNLDVLYVSTECLIAGKPIKRNAKAKYVCTMWAEKNAVKNVPRGCKSKFTESCQAPHIFLELDSVCLEH